MILFGICPHCIYLYTNIRAAYIVYYTERMP